MQHHAECADAAIFSACSTHNIALPVHKATVEKFGDEWTRPGNMVSNGAFMLADWVPQSQLTVVKNPNFHDAAEVKLDKIVYYPTEDLAEELKRYRAGELDITYDVPLGPGRRGSRRTWPTSSTTRPISAPTTTSST